MLYVIYSTSIVAKYKTEPLDANKTNTHQISFWNLRINRHDKDI